MGRNARAFTHDDRRALEWKRVVTHVDSERGAQLSGAVGEIHVPSRGGTPRPHQLDAGERLDCPHEHRAGKTLIPRDGVEAPVDSIDEVHVRRPRRAIERLGSPRPSGSRVTREVMLAEIRLRFDDAAARDAVGGVTLKHTSEQISRDELGIARVEVAR